MKIVVGDSISMINVQAEATIESSRKKTPTLIGDKGCPCIFRVDASVFSSMDRLGVRVRIC
jgi:hypothetical protein